MTEARPTASGLRGRGFADLLLFGVTLAELALLVVLTPTFTLTDWIYVSQNLLVLGITLTRRPPERQDRSLASGAAVVIAYTYTYAQVACLRWVPGEVGWSSGGLVLVTLGACLSLASLLSLGRWFGVRPALRGLATKGPYRAVRHPMYLSDILFRIGFVIGHFHWMTSILFVVSSACYVLRARYEETFLGQQTEYREYMNRVKYRFIPFIY